MTNEKKITILCIDDSEDVVTALATVLAIDAVLDANQSAAVSFGD